MAPLLENRKLLIKLGDATTDDVTAGLDATGLKVFLDGKVMKNPATFERLRNAGPQSPVTSHLDEVVTECCDPSG